MWQGQRVVVLGLARQGKAAARYLAERGARVRVSDVKPAEQLQGEREELAGLEIEYLLGGHPPELIEGADLLVLSGGVPADLPLAQQARQRGIRLTNDSQIFLEACPAPTIGITGSAGKTTTTALVGRMAAAHLAPLGRRAWVGGNIGRPLLSDLYSISADDWVVLELSSFQLELMSASPRVAAVLNITPNHLDRHRSMAAYQQAKAAIVEHQRPDDAVVLGRDDPNAWGLRQRAAARLFSFGLHPEFPGSGTFVKEGAIWLRQPGSDHPVVPLADLELRGAHNLQNALAATAIAAAAAFSPQAIRSGVRGYRGEPHRLEFVAQRRGADWYDDSIATAPERSLAALRSFEEPIVLLAGGRDKDLPWEQFAREAWERVDHLILFGEAAPKIERAVREAKGKASHAEPAPSLPRAERPEGERSRGEGRRTVDPKRDDASRATARAARAMTLHIVRHLHEAVEKAAELVQPGDLVLLSPGGTSFDEFADFAARGDRFQELVRAL
jgi:UDP-N-acetylmuramoylalanine--D-glutamate ligase